jgi:hypothetical protein
VISKALAGGKEELPAPATTRSPKEMMNRATDKRRERAFMDSSVEKAMGRTEGYVPNSTLR